MHVSEFKYFIKRAFRNLCPRRLHIVRLGLRPGYHDPDRRLLYAAFKCLEQYIVEARLVGELEYFEGCPAKQWEIVVELKELWEWWSKTRPTRERQRNILGILDYVGETEKWEDEDQKMLLRLVKVREHLWV